MPRSVVQYDLLISCPGDIKDELDIINNAVEKFNQQFSEALGISIRTRHWSKSSYAQSGGKPQTILNNQFVNDCDAAVAVFWTRFGTPTDDYGSGTEEEIENMLSSKKQVFMYFCEKPLSPAQMDSEGYKKVQEFKERYGKKGLYFEYRSNEEFDTLFFAHITEYFVSQKRIAAMTTNSPQLSVKGIVDSEVTSAPIVYPFLPLIGGKTPQDVMKEITDTFDAINNLHLEKKTNEIPFSSAVLAFNTPVEIEANTEKKIKMIAEQLEIALEDDFFELGDLSKNSLSSSAALFGCSDQSLEGTTNEKKKYNLIMRLEALFSTFIGISEFNNSFKGLFTLALCLDNSGSSYDEDIDITLL